MPLKTKGISRRKIAGILRGARQLMNHDGSHWTQGAEVDSVAIRYSTSGKTEKVFPEDGKETYCSIGGINNVKIKGFGRITEDDRSVALRALALSLDPDLERRLKWNADDIRQHASDYDDIEQLIQESDDEAIADVIISFNDEPGRTWAEVKEAFTKAARRLR